MDTISLHSLGGALSNGKKCSDNLLNVRMKRSVQYAAINPDELPSEYMPPWYKKPSHKFLYSDYSTFWYYCQDGFPSVHSQTEFTGINEKDNLMKCYDNTLWWGAKLFNVSNCVAYAVGCCMQIFNYIKTGSKDEFSPVWLHGNQSGGGSGFKKDGGRGAYVEEVLDKMISDGAVRNSIIHPYMCKYNQLQYDTEPVGYVGIGTSKKFVQEHYSELIGKAKQYKLSSWQQIDNNSIRIKETVYTLGCALLNMRMTSDLEESSVDANNGVIHDIYTDFGDMTHLMVIIGWKIIDGITYWTCVNHWANWGYRDNPNEDRTGLCWIPVNYSKILQVWKLTPNINPTFDWDYEKVQGGKFIITHKEWNRLVDRVTFKFIQRNITRNVSIEKRYPVDNFEAWNYNCAVRDLKALNGNLNLLDVKRGDYIAAKHLNDLSDAINNV